MSTKSSSFILCTGLPKPGFACSKALHRRQESTPNPDPCWRLCRKRKGTPRRFTLGKTQRAVRSAVPGHLQIVYLILLPSTDRACVVTFKASCISDREIPIWTNTFQPLQNVEKILLTNQLAGKTVLYFRTSFFSSVKLPLTPPRIAGAGKSLGCSITILSYNKRFTLKIQVTRGK